MKDECQKTLWLTDRHRITEKRKTLGGARFGGKDQEHTKFEISIEYPSGNTE